MKILVIGSGGREHALVWKIAQSDHVSYIWCAPGNPGISQERCKKTKILTECISIKAEDLPALLKFALEKKPDLTVVGPDNPLALGIVDLFQKNNLRIWGPNQKAAMIESSKIFSQDFMRKYNIPTAEADAFSDEKNAKDFVSSIGGKCAVKADGLAFGKGVMICSNQEEAFIAIDDILHKNIFGKAGEKIIIQELLEGAEISLHVICDGKTALMFPTSQDHKRVFDNDEGLNTGGMGVITPTPYLNKAQLKEAEIKIINPWLYGCKKEGIDFRGILYPGVILTKTGPKVFEFNARFGDPECQVYMPCLINDIIELFEACLDGTLYKIKLEWKPVYSVCIVLASEGYPGKYNTGKIIAGIENADSMPNIKVFHAGTKKAENDILTNGGRVLGVTAWGNTLKDAQRSAYNAVEQIQYDGMQYRKDIGNKALKKITLFNHIFLYNDLYF